MKMKNLLPLFIILTTCLASCKRDLQVPAALPGKWQQTKLVVYEKNASVVSWDTTYLTPFTNADYMQFNDNGTCVSGSDFYLIPSANGVGFSKTTQTITPSTYNFDYSAHGSVYLLTPNPNLVNYAGITTADTVSINGNTLLLHAVDYGPDHVANSIYDSYYTKQ